MGTIIISLGADSLPALGGGSRQEVGWGRQITGERVTERGGRMKQRVVKIPTVNNNSNTYHLGLYCVPGTVLIDFHALFSLFLNLFIF